MCLIMDNYWKEKYGTRSKEFIEGVIAGANYFSHVTIHSSNPLSLHIQEIKEGLGWKEVPDWRQNESESEWNRKS